MRVTYHYDEPKTPEEKEEQERRVSAVYKIIFDAVLEERKLEEKLEDYPNGFAIMDGKSYNCCICDMHIKDEELWYDKWGKKCLACQDAVGRNIIPGSICRKHKDWYINWEFDLYFKIKASTIKKLIRQDILKVRIIPKNGFEVFLIKDNAGVLPVKDILKDVSFPVEGDKNAITTIPWYEAKDPKKILGKYKIWPYSTALQADSKNNHQKCV